MTSKAMTTDACVKELTAILEGKTDADGAANMAGLKINGMPVFAYMECDPRIGLPRVIANYYMAKEFGWKGFMIVLDKTGGWKLFESTASAIRELSTNVFHMKLAPIAA